MEDGCVSTYHRRGLTHKTIIQKLTQIIANKPPQRMATGPPQRVPTPSTSVNITAPETIRTSRQTHQRQTQSNTPMPSIIEEVVDGGQVRFNLPPQRGDKNSDDWWRKYLEQTNEREVKKPNNHSRRQSNPQVIPANHKQTSR